MSLHVATRRALLTPSVAAGSDWSPTDLASIVAWHDASDATTLFTDEAGTSQVSSDNDPILHMADKVGLYNATIASGGMTYKTNIQNGLSIARATAASSQSLTIAYSTSQPYTLISVFNEPDGGGSNRFLFDGTATRVIPMMASSPYVMGMYAGSTKNSDLVSSGYQIAMWEFNGASSEIYRNGIKGSATLSPGTNALGNSRLFRNNNGTYYNGNLGELLLCNAILSTADKNSLGEYLADKWDITWSTIS